MRVVRRLRHWRQRFDPNAKFVFCKGTSYGGKWYEAGTEVPKALHTDHGRLKRFWETGFVQLFTTEAEEASEAVDEGLDDELSEEPINGELPEEPVDDGLGGLDEVLGEPDVSDYTPTAAEVDDGLGDVATEHLGDHTDEDEDETTDASAGPDGKSVYSGAPSDDELLATIYKDGSRWRIKGFDRGFTSRLKAFEFLKENRAAS